MIIKIRDTRIGRDVCVASTINGARQAYREDPTVPIYLEQELPHLKNVDNETLRWTATVKSVFPGATIESIVPHVQPEPAPAPAEQQSMDFT